FTASPTGQGTAATDSNAQPSSTTPSALLSGGSDQTIDFGYYQTVSIGDFVWNDLNADGIQNDGNTGINGVVVDLLDGSSNLITTTTTINNPVGGAPGYYQFSNLTPGTYKVQVDASNFAVGGALVGF